MGLSEISISTLQRALSISSRNAKLEVQIATHIDRRVFHNLNASQNNILHQILHWYNLVSEESPEGAPNQCTFDVEVLA